MSHLVRTMTQEEKERRWAKMRDFWEPFDKAQAKFYQTLIDNHGRPGAAAAAAAEGRARRKKS